MLQTPMAAVGRSCPDRDKTADSCIAGGGISVHPSSAETCSYTPDMSGVLCCKLPGENMLLRVTWGSIMSYTWLNSACEKIDSKKKGYSSKSFVFTIERYVSYESRKNHHTCTCTYTGSGPFARELAGAKGPKPYIYSQISIYSELRTLHTREYHKS